MLKIKEKENCKSAACVALEAKRILDRLELQKKQVIDATVADLKILLKWKDSGVSLSNKRRLDLIQMSNDLPVPDNVVEWTQSNKQELAALQQKNITIKQTKLGRQRKPFYTESVGNGPSICTWFTISSTLNLCSLDRKLNSNPSLTPT